MALISVLRRGGRICRHLLFTSPICPERNISSNLPQLNNERNVEVTFVLPCGKRVKANGKVGENLLDVVINNNVDIDGFGACEGTLTCSTCHLIFNKKDYQALPDEPSIEENDMLDLAFEVTDTSRLGCQVRLTENMNGLEVKVPSSISDLRSDN